jgi:membrane dipeptidase
MPGMVIDGHNDLALTLWKGEEPRHLDLAEAGQAGFAGGFFALNVPSRVSLAPEGVPYDLPLPPPIPFEEADRISLELYDVLRGLPVVLATSADDFREGSIAAIVHLEGAEAIAPDLSNLAAWHARGLRSVGPVWSRANAFGEGVPFRFPSSPDTGPGLTPAGIELIRACNRLGVLVDLSHLNEAGFWDVARVSEAPLVATHSNAHALCASTRNLTDEQLHAICDTRGVVGVNFGVTFLREDGRHLPDETPIDEILRHVDYLVEVMGIDHVAFGSDFDGTSIPTALGGVAGLPKLVDGLRVRGYDDDAVAKVTHGNWLRVLRATWL